MKRVIGVVLLFAIILVGGSQLSSNQVMAKRDNLESQVIGQELSQEDIKISNDMDINRGVYSYGDKKDMVIGYDVNKYGYQEVVREHGYEKTGLVRTTNGKFLVLEVAQENIGGQESSLITSFLVADDQDRGYSCIGLYNEDKKEITNTLGAMKKLQSGEGSTLCAVFEVPSDFEIDRFVFDMNWEEKDGVGQAIEIEIDRLEECEFGI